MLSLKKRFGICLSMIISSSVMLFLFSMTLAALKYIAVTGSNPLIPNFESFVIYLIIGLCIGVFLFISGVAGLYRMVKVGQMGQQG